VSAFDRHSTLVLISAELSCNTYLQTLLQNVRYCDWALFMLTNICCSSLVNLLLANTRRSASYCVRLYVQCSSSL